MVTRVLRALRLGLRGSWLGVLLRRLRITELGRAIYEKRLLRQKVHEAVIMGKRLRFAVRAPCEISRIDSPDSEEPFIGRMLEAITPHDVCYDVGANIGVITLLLALHHRGSGVTVHAFEPEPRNAAQLRANLILNELDNVVVHELALGAATGQAELFVDEHVGSGAHSLVAGHVAGTPTIPIPVVSGAEFARDAQAPPDVLKVDVEGAEMEVLHGFQELFDAGRVRDLFVEVHSQTLERLGSSPKELRHWLEERDYRLQWSSARGSEIHEHYQFEGTQQ